MFSMQRSRIPRLTRAEPRPTRAERREQREAAEVAAFERTHEGRVATRWLESMRNTADPEWASQPACPHLSCPAGRFDVLLGEARLAVTRCVHGQCTETAVRPIGDHFACELHKTSPEGN
jgi:hypothetical protein